MKRRVLAMALALTIIISGVCVHAASLEELTKNITKVTDITDSQLTSIKEATEEKFTDYDSNGWYAKFVAKLVAIKGIDGYPDDSFKPNGTITKAEFLKILVASIYGEQSPTRTHWASGYVKKAETVGILSSGEVSESALDKAITRQEMAKFISLAMEKSLNEAKATNLEDIKRSITDKASIGAAYSEHVYNAYGKGIISGYTDKSFGPTKTATRAEACTMLVKMLDKNERQIPGEVKWETTTLNGWVVPTVNYDRWTKVGLIEYEFDKEYECFSIDIGVGRYSKRSIIDQWVATEMALNSKLDAATVKSIMDYIKTKTNSDIYLEIKYFNTSKYEIKVNDTGETIQIKVWTK